MALALRTLGSTLAVLALCLLAGCEVPAQVYWSPDGGRAAYVPPGGAAVPAAIIDAQGNILEKLAPSSGGFAWSADSRKLYYATITPRPQNLPATPVDLSWANIAENQPIPATQPAAAEQVACVNVWENGKSQPLFSLPSGQPYWMALSPDQNYLALVMNDDKWSALYVYSLPAKKLSLLSFQCARTACFTGPHRLAFVEPSEMFQDRPSPVGMLAEVTLDDQAQKLDRQQLLVVIPQFTPWIQAVGEDILLSTYSFAVPAPPPQEEPQVLDLYRYSRAQRKVHKLAESTGQFFMPSPNGKLVMFEKVHNNADPASRGSDLAILDLASGQAHIAADAKVAFADPGGVMHSGMPAFPAWRGDGEISFTAPVAHNQPPIEHNERFVFELALYRLTADFKLEPIRTLSEKWPVEMKPSIANK